MANPRGDFDTIVKEARDLARRRPAPRSPERRQWGRQLAEAIDTLVRVPMKDGPLRTRINDDLVWGYVRARRTEAHNA